MDATERRATVLKAVVEEYVQPPSPSRRRPSPVPRPGVSSATVRNDMTQLEREGYIVQPHTSAGRIPTDQGYRYFVDHFTEGRLAPRRPAPRRRRLLRLAHHALEDLLHETSLLLARLTSHAAVVVGPQFPTPPRVRSAQLIALAAGSCSPSPCSQRLDREGVLAQRRRGRSSRPGQRRARRALAGAASPSRPRCGRRTGDAVVDALVRRVDASGRRASSGVGPPLRRRRQPDRRRAGRVRDHRARPRACSRCSRSRSWW